MEVRENDAKVSRDRMLSALEGCTDLEKGQSLWKAARKYNQRMRIEAGMTGLESVSRPLAARGGAR